MKTRLIFLAVFLLLLVSLIPAASANEITFQPSEVDVGQSGGDRPINGDEWSSYGITMSGTDLYVYGAIDPFTPDDRNGIFENTGNSFEIEFTKPAVNVEVSWWSPASSGVTMTAYDVNGAQISAQTSSAQFDVFRFNGVVKRIVIEAPNFSLCLANLKFFNESTPVPTLRQIGLFTLTFMLLVLGGLVLRRRGFWV